MKMNKLKTAVFGGGCFWCVEAVFKRLRGVDEVVSGYAGGSVRNPTYEQVSGGETGHVEVIRVSYDPAAVKYETLLDVFFASHDPTTLDRQGNDVGPQYRSAIFYADDGQKTAAEDYVKKLEADGTFSDPIVTEIKQLDDFYPAEDYHQDFYDSNRNYPYCSAVIDPKVAKLRQKFAPYLKPEEQP
jgi:peptide-methionine (S)-S-oxide reductase